MADVSRILSERNIDIISMNVRTNKKETTTFTLSFAISSVEELNRIIEKIRQVDSILDIERSVS